MAKINIFAKLRQYPPKLYEGSGVAKLGPWRTFSAKKNEIWANNDRDTASDMSKNPIFGHFGGCTIDRQKMAQIDVFAKTPLILTKTLRELQRCKIGTLAENQIK